MPHIIRLRGPWQYEVLEGRHPKSQTVGKVRMPTSWHDTLGSDFLGQVRCVRHFGMPTGLDADSRVTLVVGQHDAGGQISLNGQRLNDPHERHQSVRFDITHRLQRRNELCIDITLPLPGPSGEVHLELATRA